MKTNLHQLSPPSIYSQDFNLWIQQTTSQIRSGNFDLVDWENVLEELESLGKSDQRELKSRLSVLLTPTGKNMILVYLNLAKLISYHR